MQWAGLRSMATAYISAGSNTGDSAALLKRAVCLLSEPFVPAGAVSGQQAGHVSLTVTAVSSVYRTEPQHVKDQPFFRNLVVRVYCPPECCAGIVLNRLLHIETLLGRVRNTGRFGPRAMDLDLLLYGNTILDDERLTLPHPRMVDRAFVLVPLAEIEPELVLPDGTAVSTLLQRLCFRQVGDTIFQ